MTYSNLWKRTHGCTVTVGAQTFAAARVIGIPGDFNELIEKTTLGSSRKEWDLADRTDSDTIEIETAWTGAASLAGSSAAACSITLGGSLGTVSFTAHVVRDLPQPAEVGGLLIRKIVLKPLGTT